VRVHDLKKKEIKRIDDMSELKAGLRPADGPKIAVVLASGSIKAFSSLALFEFLAAQQINIDLLIGCSGGSIIAAAVGAGMPVEKIRENGRKFLNKDLFAKKDFRAMLGMYNLPFGRFNKTSGFLKPDRIISMYKEVFGDKRLEELQPKTLLQVTDMDSGQGNVLESGLVADAVYASGALFPILPPIEIDGHLYADGFYTSSLPVVEAVKRHMDVIIAVIFEDPIHPSPRRFFSCFNNIYKIQSTAVTKYQMALSIDLHDYEIITIKVPFRRTIKMWDVDAVPNILEAGKLAVEQKKEEILDAINTFRERRQRTA
jgi:NTE family protein